ncbi:PHD finger protein ING2-like [Panicum virgatum]|uniref:PHD finger protein ING2-like n=1 Tax=Panicum virgatum TaxID=38727 RepID=UPI0019D5EDD8|nr:PHD finger protein ING2-like [Panicum virgatum]
MEDPGPSSAATEPPPPSPPLEEEDGWVILPPSEVEGIGDPKVIHWEDLQQELARLWSLSAALQSGRDCKAQLAARLESALEPGIIPGKGWIRLHTFGCASSVKRRVLQRFCVWNRADSSTLAGDLQRILSTMRELDDRSYHFFESLALCGYLIISTLDIIVQIESHIKRLDEDLGQFAEDLKHEGKIPPDEPPVLPPVPVVSRDEKRRLGFSTPQSSKKFREREWDRERGMDFDLMPPPGSSKKAGTSMDVDQMIDPNEPTYCICHQVSYGDMIAYDNENVSCLVPDNHDS